jgi:hypothetical protein
VSRVFQASLVIIVCCAACDRGEPAAPVVATASAPAHGDHSPHHDGVVMMKGDLHYEVVLDPAGRYRMYFTDATRADLPAATALHAAITVMRPGEPPEGVELQIDEAGESWVGQGRPVLQPAQATARISYTIRGEEPYWIDLAFDAKPLDPHKP